MKRILALSLLLTSCGTTPAQRDGAYVLAATLAGKPELIPVIYGVRRVITSPKQPVNVQP